MSGLGVSCSRETRRRNGLLEREKIAKLRTMSEPREGGQGLVQSFWGYNFYKIPGIFPRKREKSDG